MGSVPILSVIYIAVSNRVSDLSMMIVKERSYCIFRLDFVFSIL